MTLIMSLQKYSGGIASIITWKLVNYQHPFSPHKSHHKISCLVMRIKELITHSKLPNMKSKFFPKYFKGKYGYSWEEFSNLLNVAFGA